jgi:hypothetical protein
MEKCHGKESALHSQEKKVKERLPIMLPARLYSYG